MPGQHFLRKISRLRGWVVFLPLFLMILSGCRAAEPPLSPAAAAFKKEVQECLDRLCHGVVDALVKRDVAAINETLKHLEPDTMKLCRMCPFRIGVLDKNGITVTVYPFKADAMGNFSSYEAVAQTVNNHKISQQRLFLQDGAQIYIICVPLLKEGNLAGILVLSLDAKEAKSRWGLTEEDFKVIDFNTR